MINKNMEEGVEMTKTEELQTNLRAIKGLLEEIKTATRNFRGFREPEKTVELYYLLGATMGLADYHIQDKV